MFSHLKRSPAELASSKADTDRRLAVVIGAHQDNDEALLIRARELYSTHLSCGRSRSTIRQARVDRGRVGKRRPASKQAWVRQRQAAVGAAARQEAELVTPQRRPRAELPESLAKESAKQDALQKKRKAEAWLEGTLLDKEATAEVREEAAKRQKIDASNDKDRRRKFQHVSAIVKLRARRQGKDWALQSLQGPATLLATCGADTNLLKEKLRAAGVGTFVEARIQKLQLPCDDQ